ncbi:Nif3-like dinuclear metal center hexameric protein [Anaerostipes sp.]|uniref:Nif3-like dinuclear metal center hexameric protein n=1 Tax=Anaerostipes sp. TaxID=1872530 RepID=UPI0025BB2879|nr:Nif3-like dinuclear metal center hexameric protein [Anaerostipes sp.]MBS7008355.1 Nif3-like dinuclear metal center hexameric protein [Anaerostipes sp.]
MKCSELIEILEAYVPADYAMEWDNVGLLAGRRDREIKKIMVALDADNGVVEEAVSQNVDFLLTHHPLIFSPLKSITVDAGTPAKLLSLLENGVSCYAMHTNFDVVHMGKIVCEALGLESLAPVEVTCTQDGVPMGIGTVSELDRPISADSFADLVKKAFDLKHVLLFGDGEKEIQRIAAVPGSGRHMEKAVSDARADLFLTGDIGHHEGLDALDLGITVIDAGHHGLEKIFVDFMGDYLQKHIPECEIILRHTKCPFDVK